jgi:small subunit ribosomal protein S3
VGQKVNPVGFRRGVYTSWDARWFARNKKYAQSFFEDLKMNEFIQKRLSSAEISRIEMEKAGDDSVRIVIHSARPAVVIGKRGEDVAILRRDIAHEYKKKSVEVSVQEVKRPDLDARLVAKEIAHQIERRASYKKAMKKAASDAMRSGARGIEWSRNST